MAFAYFMAGSVGRIIRFTLGIGLIVFGLSLQNGIGVGLAIFGVVPLAAGIMNWCPSGMLFGLPLRAADILKRR